jgi:hypothetical protein
MAQTGFTPIQLYSTSTAAAAPVAGNLTNSTLGSELAINITDGKLFYKDNTNAVQVIGWKIVPTTAGGTGLTTYTAGDLSYYASGTTFTKLAIGASTTILTSTGSAPQWSATSGITVGTATNLAGGLAGSVPYQTGAGATTFLGIGASGRFLSSTGSAPQWSAPAALTEVDDTNITMTLGGTPSTALLSSVSMTLGWTGTLAVSRGGTGTGTAFTAGSVLFAGASGVYSQDNTNFFWDDTNNNLGLRTNAPLTTLHSYSGQNTFANGAQFLLAKFNSQGTAWSSLSTLPSSIFNGNATDRPEISWYRGSRTYPEFSIRQHTTNDTGGEIYAGGGTVAPTKVAEIKSTGWTFVGDTTLSTGNLVIGTSGKGIDFSATAGTGTSELLADYEEGTWSPTYVPSTGSFASIVYAFQTGAYTKVGNLVTVTGAFRITSMSIGTAGGTLAIGGLPFSVSSASACTIGFAGSFTANTPLSGNLVSGATSINLQYRSAVTAQNTANTPADLGTTANTNYLIFSAVYTTAT